MRSAISAGSRRRSSGGGGNAGSLPVGGFSPGNMYQTTFSKFSQEKAEYVAISNGHRFMLRLDHEETIQDCLNQGWDVCYVVGASFSWTNIPGGSVSAYASMCADVATRWKGVTGLNGARLAVIEIGGNEPNSGGITPAQEVQLIQAATPLVRAADPSLLISAGGLGPFPDTLPKYQPRTFVTQMFSSGLKAGDYDIYQGHLYEHATARGAWNTWDQTFPNAPGTSTRYGTFPVGTTIREMLDSHGMSGVYIMSGESGLPDQTGLLSGRTAIKDGFADFAARRAAGEKIGPFLVFTMRPDWVTVGTDSGYGCVDLSWNRNLGWTDAQSGIAG